MFVTVFVTVFSDSVCDLSLVCRFGHQQFMSNGPNGPNGNVHDGWYSVNDRHGWGRYKWANGDMYQGDWFKGKVLSVV